MNNEEVNNENNNLTGTMFSPPKITKDSPVKCGFITIDGVVLNFCVYPERTSLRGRKYNPIKLRYVKESSEILRAVSINNHLVRGE